MFYRALLALLANTNQSPQKTAQNALKAKVHLVMCNLWTFPLSVCLHCVLGDSVWWRSCHCREDKVLVHMRSITTSQCDSGSPRRETQTTFMTAVVCYRVSSDSPFWTLDHQEKGPYCIISIKNFYETHWQPAQMLKKRLFLHSSLALYRNTKPLVMLSR